MSSKFITPSASTPSLPDHSPDTLLQSLLSDLPSFSTDPQFHASVSRAYASNGQLPEAECFAYSSIRLNPTIPDGFLALSSTFYILGFPHEASLASSYATSLVSSSSTTSFVSSSSTTSFSTFDLQPVPFSFPVMQILCRSPQFQRELENPAIIALIQEIRITGIVPESSLFIREMLDFAFAELISDDSFFSCDCPSGCHFPTARSAVSDFLTEPQLLRASEEVIEPNSEELKVRAASQRIIECTGDQQLEAILDRGEGFAELGAIEAALGDFEAVLRMKPASVRALLGAAMALLALGKLMEACDRFVGVLELDNENTEALNGFTTLLKVVKGVKLSQERWDVTKMKLAQCKCAQSPAIQSFFGTTEGGSRLEGNLADPEFREVLRALMDDGLIVSDGVLKK